MAYKRVLLKLSGEALNNGQGRGIDPGACQNLATQIQRLHEEKIQIGIVLGGGNIFRGKEAKGLGMARSPADHIGMLATIINGISLHEALRLLGVRSRVMSALGATEIVERYEWKSALKYLEAHRVVIFVGGTGNPFFTTDTCAALRAAQMQADVLLKATQVDGVYDKDPNQFPDAQRFDTISYLQALEIGVQVMDATAISLCRENQIPIKVFSNASLYEGATQPNFGTLVS